MWVRTDRRQIILLLLIVVGTSGCAVFGKLGNLGNRQRVALLEIDGPRKAAAQARESVRDLLASDYDVVSRDRYDATAQRLSARRMRPKSVAMVAAELKLVAVVHGKVVKTGRKRYAVRVRVREGLSGQVTRQIQLPLKRGQAHTKRGDVLLATIDKLPPPFTLEAAPEPEPDEAEGEAKLAKAAESDRVEPEQAKKAEPDGDRAERVADKPATAKRTAPRVDKRGQVIDDEIPKHLK